MGWFTGIVVYILTWWISLFFVLPFGHQREEDGTTGKANIKRKFLITSLMSVVIWCVIYLLVVSDWISFHDMAMKMIEEDHLGS